MPDPAATDLGTIYVNARRVTFPFGAPPGVGGGHGPPPGDTPEIGDDPGVIDLCADISFLSDSQKIDYVVRYVVQEVADLIRVQSVQNREWGSVIYRRADGSFGFTPLTPTTTHQANVAWGSLPQVVGQIDWSSAVALIHSHPRLNIEPVSGQDNWDYYLQTDPSYLLRPWAGDWLSYTGLVSNMGASPNAANVALFLLGYTETNTLGRLALHGYSGSDNPGGGGQTPTVSPEISGLQPPCNENI
jgi:hypothetical protein